MNTITKEQYENYAASHYDIQTRANHLFELLGLADYGKNTPQP